MVIRVHDITDRVRRLNAVEDISEHPVLKEMQETGECMFRSPLAIDLSVVREYDHIRLEGSISIDVTLTCARCLVPYERTLKSVFTVFYTKAVKASVMPDEEVELGESELVSAYFEGDEIDVSPEIVDHVLMELPVKPLCKDTCRGLCANCGSDLNVSVCNCPEQGGSLAFSALKNLKLVR